MVDIKIGTKVILEPGGNARRRHVDYMPGTITKVGRTYFYVSVYGDESNPDRNPIRFEKATLKHSDPNDCNTRYNVYESMEQYQEHVDLIKMTKALRQYFTNFTTQYEYSTIKKVYDIMLEDGAIRE